jgi:recombinational DNA repair protein (RecF pathway)
MECIICGNPNQPHAHVDPTTGLCFCAHCFWVMRQRPRPQNVSDWLRQLADARDNPADWIEEE